MEKIRNQDGKIRIRDKHPAATLVFKTFRSGFMVWYDNGTCPVDIGGRRICLKYANIQTGVIGEKQKLRGFSLPVGI